MVLLDSKSTNSAKLIIVGDYPSKERLDRIVKEIAERHNFKISFIELNHAQYEGLRTTSSFNLDKKVLFKRG